MHIYTITTKLACMGWEAVFGLISIRSAKDILRYRAHFPFRSSLEHQLISVTWAHFDAFRKIGILRNQVFRSAE